MLDELPRLPERHGVDVATFRNEIVPAYQPVVLKGLVRDWPAVRAGAGGPHAMADYLMQFDRGRPAITFIGDHAIGGRFFYRDDMTGVNFEQKEETFRASLERIIAAFDDPAPPAVYIGSQPIPDVVPDFGPANRTDLVDPAVIPRIWIGNAITVSAHYDLSDNIACVAGGRRRFTLLPPDQLPNLYVGPLEFTLAGQPCSLVSFKNPDFERHPKFREALKHARVADLEPGDAIYIPYLWWHHVESFDPLNVLVNYWWTDAQSGAPEAFEALVHAILAVRHNPPLRREAWRKIFEHYVFEANGDPAQHIPVHARGILGAMSPQLATFIRSWLTRVMGSRMR